MQQDTALALSFKTLQSAQFENLGSTIEIVSPESPASNTSLAGKSYTVKQFHFHTPSEHLLDGEHFPLEMHIVHESQGKRSVSIADSFLVCILSDESRKDWVRSGFRSAMVPSRRSPTARLGCLLAHRTDGFIWAKQADAAPVMGL
jgi:hypothetical protein